MSIFEIFKSAVALVGFLWLFCASAVILASEIHDQGFLIQERLVVWLFFGIGVIFFVFLIAKFR